MTDDFKPRGYPRLIPRIFTDDPEGLVAFIRECFGAQGEVTQGRPTEVWLGDSMLMVAGAAERPAQTAAIYLYVPDVEEAYARAIGSGAVEIEKPQDTHYGERRAMVRDRWGNTWQLARTR